MNDMLFFQDHGAKQNNIVQYISLHMQIHDSEMRAKV